MKKLYTIALFMMISAISFSQISNDGFSEPTDVSIKTLKSNHIYSSFAGKAPPFWSEDFSGGIPTTWTHGSTPTPPVISAPWVYRGPSTTPGVNTGSQGAYAGAHGVIISPTVANGFMIFDSDYYDNGGTQGNFGAGTYPCNGMNGAPPVGHIGTLTTDAIDCSQYPDISMFFNSFYRQFTGIAKIAFSIDSGVTFTDTVDVHPNIDVNDKTDNDYQVMVRMPFNIVGNTDVRIQFIYDGTVLYGNYNGYYFWMIDDIELVETPAYLLSITDVNYGGWNTTPFSESFGMDYTYTPLNHASANPYKFEASLTNAGANDLNNVVLHAIVIDDMGSQVYSGTSDPDTIVILDTIITKTTTNFIAISMGVYDFSFWGSSDSISYTDTSYMQAIVTDTVYGRDYNNPKGSWRVGRSCGGLQLGNIFDVFVADELTSVSAFVADYSVPGAQMFGVLYEVDTSGGSLDFIYLDQTDDYTITTADTNNWVHIAFDGGYPLSAGKYMISIGGYANPVDTFGINVSGDAPVSMSRIQDNGCNLGQQSFGFWYWISSTPMIRMNFGSPWTQNQNNFSCNGTDPCVSDANGIWANLLDCNLYCIGTRINENIFDGKLTIYPNPSEGIFNIDLVDVKNGDYLISVSNILGEEVYSEKRGVNSTTSTTINLSNLESGLYMLNIRNGDSSISKKLIIE